MLIFCIILLLMIEDVMCCLCELCFDAGKLITWMIEIVIFLGRELMVKNISQDMSFSWVANNEYKSHFVNVICDSHVAYTICDLIKCGIFLNIFLHVFFYQFFFLLR